VGFGISLAKDGGWYVVVNYFPPGNSVGQYLNNVMKPIKPLIIKAPFSEFPSSPRTLDLAKNFVLPPITESEKTEKTTATIEPSPPPQPPPVDLSATPSNSAIDDILKLESVQLKDPERSTVDLKIQHQTENK
jgi:hypothetical protein